MKKVVIIDYGLGNIFSIKQAFLAIGVEPLVSSNAQDIRDSDGILLPGMGAFADAIRRLKDLNLLNEIKNCVAEGKPILGICLGLQLLFDKSEEFGEHEGLGIIRGVVRRFPESNNGIALTVPFIGWNRISEVSNPYNFLLKDMERHPKMFFVHSYYVDPDEKSKVLGFTHYQAFDYPAIIQYKNISGFQGHPEKSGLPGLQLYKNWVKSL